MPEILSTRLKAEAYRATLYALIGIRPAILVSGNRYSFQYTPDEKKAIKNFLLSQIKRKPGSPPADIALNIEPLLLETGLEQYGGIALVAAFAVFILGRITK